MILIDCLNTSITDQIWARQQVVKFLRQIQPQDRVAVYALGGGVRVLQDFTSDSTRLVQTVTKFGGEFSHYLQNPDPDPSQMSDAFDQEFLDWLRAINSNIAADILARRVSITTEALKTIAEHIGQLPGRKSLVWVTSAFPFSIGLDAPMNLNGPPQQRVVFETEVRPAIEALNRANIAVYPLDARGLIAVASGGGAAKQGNVLATRADVIIPTLESAVQLTPGADTMNIVADRTGGRAFYNTNDIMGAIRKAVDDAEMTYTLGFHPDAGSLDSKFHALKVELNRGGVNLLYRKGYYASPETQPTERERARQIGGAVSSPIDALEISLSAQVDPVDQPRAGSRRVTLRIDPADVALQRQGGRWTGALELVVSRRSKDGRDLGTTSETARMNLDDATYEQLRKQGFVLIRTIVPVGGLAQIRLVVYDHTSGRLGSLTVPAAQ